MQLLADIGTAMQEADEAELQETLVRLVREACGSVLSSCHPLRAYRRRRRVFSTVCGLR